jgi:L-aspartate oxidase
MSSVPAELLKFRRRSGADRAIVIGGGLAGLFTALKLAPLPVTVLTPRALGDGTSSAWAQGGIAAAIGEGDTPEAHARDTIAAGAGLVDPAIAHLIASEAAERIDDLLRYGVPFDRDLEGKLRLSREAAHSARRIARVNGDQAGRAVMAALISAASATPSISVLENVEAIDLVREDGRIVGVYAMRAEQPDRASFIPARAVVLATGGIGHLFRITTNPKEASGSGLAMAARAGAIICDPEFVQFHPTAFDVGQDPAPLASEAIRGDGATLVNKAGERFMTAAHEKAELAPRDVVARAVHREIAAGRGAFLDCRNLDLQKGFPTAYAICEKAGIDPKKQPIPIAPAAHYHMGGVFTDASGRTTIAGLWACGEVACTRAHGANRLASNSLLEAVVFGARVAQDILAEAPQWYAFGNHNAIPETVELPSADPAAAASFRHQLRDTMAAEVGVERSEASLKSALSTLSVLQSKALAPSLRAMSTAALFIAAAAYARRESRGAHFRPGLAATLDKPSHTFLTLANAQAILAEATGSDDTHTNAGSESRRRRAS